MKDSKNIFKKLGLIGIGLCAACCLLPIATVTFGLGALTMISDHIEWIWILAMILAITVFWIIFFRKRQPHACDISCDCKDEKHYRSS
jgi:lipoprotein signal peptidase